MTHIQPCQGESNTLKRVKQRISHIHQEEKLMHLQHDNARPHAGAETEKIRLHGVPCPPYSPQWALPDFWLFAALMNVSKDFISYVIRKFKLIWENDSEHNMKSSTAMGLNVQHWGRCIKWVEYYVEKRGTEIKYAFWAILCFDSFQDLVKIQTWMHYFLNTLHSDKMSSTP